ncbi:MAG: cyclodeaminase/cyclohydrolase family protein [Deltaproteobacteria bacterium]|nr:cyclodeaminase/cyclohydrolase family protein [Deltaproteobacteria bacterium]MBW2137567.1 cyclodeaminase/cyclohydrolase family protein [Deltaproteobacteria bacterium]
MDLGKLTLKEALKALASPSATPGGGSTSALAGAMGVSLCAMVAGLTLAREKYRDSWKEMESIQKNAQDTALRLSILAERDMEAYTKVMEAYKLPKNGESEKKRRRQAIQAALKEAACVPMETLKATATMVEPLKILLEKGNPNCLTDAGVAALLIESAAKGAVYNIRVNLSSIDDAAFSEKMAEEAREVSERVKGELGGLRDMVEKRLG